MSRSNIVDGGKTIEINIPLTTMTGKVRVKYRSSVFEYGLPFASRQKDFTLRNYIEWQIGYDAVLNAPEKIAETTLRDLQFTAYNRKSKALYELSEYMFYLVKWRMVSRSVLCKLIQDIKTVGENDLLEKHSSCQIKRTHPRETSLNGVRFLESKIEYPLFIHRFGQYEIIAEIVVREKQYAVGTQAMLYFCFPVTELLANPALLGRKAKPKETATFLFNQSNFNIIPEMIRIFGMLSKAHQFDILAILDVIRRAS